MKLKPTVSMPMAKAACGRALTDEDRRTLLALAEWILQGCPEIVSGDSTRVDLEDLVA
ncbi:MAG: hypothetical protein V3S71_02755 [Acidobacteriota bacterium]